MTSYKSLSGELADLMKQAELDTDMRPVARLRRNTFVEVPQFLGAGHVAVIQKPEQSNFMYQPILVLDMF